METPDESYESIEKEVDSIVSEKTERKISFDPTDFSPELKQVEDNLRFVKKLENKPIKKGKHEKTIFCYEQFDPEVQVFGDNIWNRSIFITDKINDMFFAATLEQQMKYVKKKRHMSGNMVFLLIIILGGIGIIIFVLFLMSNLGVI